MKIIKATAVTLGSVLALSCFGIIGAGAASSDVIIGDADCDGRVTIADATQIQRYICETVTFDANALLAADADEDGAVTVRDATEIQRYLVDMSSSNIGQPVTSATEPTTESTTATEATTESTAATEPTTVDPDAWKSNTGTIVFGSTIQVSGSGAYVDGKTVYITEGGDWEVTGTLANGMIYVNTGEEKDDNDKVKLRLNGMSLTNTDGPAIYFDRCKKAFITIEDGSTNTVCDSAVYSDANAEAKATIHSDDSLEIKGKGTLNVTSNYKHGINSDDDINIENGKINITSATDGLHANDNITINGKNVAININSTADGIESEGDITGTLGTVTINAAGKGIKATADMNIAGGTYNITSTDDSVHSNANINITGGTFTINSGDDGIHADTTVTIDDGTINVNKSYEGIEGSDIVINGGNITVKASDDGINAAGGNDGSSINGRPGQNIFNPSTSSNSSITFAGGYVFVNASGDGIDSNGSINILGGTVVSVGPNDGGNSCLDSDAGVTYTGGTFMGIASSSSMWSEVTNSLTTKVFNTSLGNVASGSTIAVTDADGNVLSVVKPSISGNLGVVYVTDTTTALSSCKFITGGTYSGTLDDNGYGTGGTISGGTTVSPSTSTTGGGGFRPR